MNSGGSNRFWMTVAGLSAFIAVIVFLTAVETCREIKTIQQKVDEKFEHIPVPTKIIPKYDSITQSRIDSIESARRVSHRHVDNLYDNQLQDVLDSLYNAAR